MEGREKIKHYIDISKIHCLSEFRSIAEEFILFFHFTVIIQVSLANIFNYHHEQNSSVIFWVMSMSSVSCCLVFTYCLVCVYLVCVSLCLVPVHLVLLHCQVTSAKSRKAKIFPGLNNGAKVFLYVSVLERFCILIKVSFDISFLKINIFIVQPGGVHLRPVMCQEPGF